MNSNGDGMVLELDAVTAHLVEQLAQTWGVSKEEVIRRAVEQADTATRPVHAQDRLGAFKKLQRSLNLTPSKAAEWQCTIREARR